MAKGTTNPMDKGTVNSWFNLSEKQAETISWYLNLVVVGFACFGAAASAWLAIPKLLEYIPYQVSPFLTGTGYFLSVISGITYAKAQFWDRSFKKIKQYLLWLESEDQQEIEKCNDRISVSEKEIFDYLNSIKNQQNTSENKNLEVQDTLKKLVIELYKLKNNVRDEKLPSFSDMVLSLKSHLNLTDELFDFYFKNHIEQSGKQKTYEFMDWLTDISLEIAGIINKCIAVLVIFSGSAIALILTTFGSKNAIFSIFSDLIGASALTGTLLWGPAIFIAGFTQVCKLFLNFDRQMLELDYLGFTKRDLDHDVKYLQDKSKLLNECSKSMNIIVNNINTKSKISELEEQVKKLTPLKKVASCDSATQFPEPETPLNDDNNQTLMCNLYGASKVDSPCNSNTELNQQQLRSAIAKLNPDLAGVYDMFHGTTSSPVSGEPSRTFSPVKQY